MSKHLDQVREALEFYRDNEWNELEAGEVIAALSAHEEELRGLIDILSNIRTCAWVDGRSEWLAVAELLDAVIAKFGETK